MGNCDSTRFPTALIIRNFETAGRKPPDWVFGLHRNYLKQEHATRYTALLLTCELWAYLADLNKQAEELVKNEIVYI